MSSQSLLSHTLPLTLATLGALGLLACDPAAAPEVAASDARDALLFDLTEDELVEIHEAYLADEDLALTRARLTAPFDCSLYDDFCAEVGADAALEITGEMIDLAREGAPIAEIQALLDTRIHAALREGQPLAPEDELTFRGSGDIRYHTQGNFRLSIRNGITTPVLGDRRAWTQAITWYLQPQGVLPPMWTTAPAAEICVDAGVNTQVHSYPGLPAFEIESIDPVEGCVGGDNDLEISTWHDRLTGSGSASYKIMVKGCATANLNGLDFNKCALTYSETF